MSVETVVPFGEVLKQYRLAAGLTQESLAERAGVSARNIQNLERGENRPLKDTARRLAEALVLGEREQALLLTLVTPSPRCRAPALAAPTGQADLQPPETPETPLPSGMLTFLIADVRGYTAYTHRHGGEAGAALATQFAALAAESVTAYEGRVVEVRGDEVLAVFTSVRRALRAAVDLFARCECAATPALPLRAGVGLDVGEPIPVPGGYRGEAINVAARLCTQAGAGEVLASETVIGLARRVEGLAYEEHGALVLKGISQPVRAWRVRAGTAAEADISPAVPGSGPAVAPPPPRHNLPAALFSFIGRAREREKVLTLLGESRLVTLVGVGGVGKTRLALAVAEALIDTYADGVWLVEPAPLADPALAPAAVARTLGLREEPGSPLPATLTDHFKSRQTLLVLDNCEHVVTACADLTVALLRACPGLRILATSRKGLDLAGEHRYRVPSLTVPDAGHLPPTELAASYEAVRLFLERAQERRHDFALTDGNAQMISEICARLDGVPLAIELAAAQVGSLRVADILARLDDHFRLLTGGSRAALPRRQTLRAALDWSWELLNGQERTLLGRLSVFAGGWTLQAAEAVCTGAGIEERAVLDIMDALVNRSLAQADETGEGEARYRLLETVRQYAGERLAEAGTDAMVRSRHLAWCVALAEQAAPRITGAAQGVWLSHLEIEHDNLREALRWATTGAGDPVAGLALAGALWRFWDLHGHLREGRAWLELVLDRGDAPTAARAWALKGAGNLAWSQGDYARSAELLDASLRLHRELGDRVGIAASLNGLGLVSWRQGEYARAVTFYEESLALHRERGDARDLAGSLGNLGH